MFVERENKRISFAIVIYPYSGIKGKTWEIRKLGSRQAGTCIITDHNFGHWYILCSELLKIKIKIITSIDRSCWVRFDAFCIIL